jgi:hypothetical protein
MVRYTNDLPYSPVIREIHNMTCGQIANYAHYVFYRNTQKVYQKAHEYTVQEFCRLFPDVPGRSFLVRAEAGPPFRRKFMSLTLSELVNDWYWLAKSNNAHHILVKFQGAMDAAGLAVKV